MTKIENQENYLQKERRAEKGDFKLCYQIMILNYDVILNEILKLDNCIFAWNYNKLKYMLKMAYVAMLQNFETLSWQL